VHGFLTFAREEPPFDASVTLRRNATWLPRSSPMTGGRSPARSPPCPQPTIFSST
jgi:hypothetical protein